MNLISAILCSTAAVGGSLMIPGVASATSVHCTAEGGADITVIEGSTGCRAASDAAGHARSAGYDGVGYARASQGAAALGVGAAGGVGASEGTGGIPIAVGVGPDAMALSMIAADPAAGPAMAVAIAFQGSRAEVGGTPDGSVVCLGSGAIAWNMQSGATCLTTPFGSWKPTLPVTAADRS